MPLLLPPPVPVDQLAEVGRLLAVSDDELVFEQLLGGGTLRGRNTPKDSVTKSFSQVENEQKRRSLLLRFTFIN